MNYLLLSDIRLNGKVLKAGTISNLKDLDKKEIPSLIFAKVIAEFTSEILVDTVKQNIEKQEKIVKETDKEEKEIESDFGISTYKEPTIEATKKRGRPKSN